MRLAGICIERGGMASMAVPAMWTKSGAGCRKRSNTLISSPATRSILAVVAVDARPKVDWASLPNGSFAIVDGDVYEAPAVASQAAEPRGSNAAPILDLYSLQGEDAMLRVNGAASIVLWDAGRETLLLYRDRWGAVPLYYAEQGSRFYWASDVGTLLHADLPTEMNLAAVDFFLGNGFVPAPWTLAERIKKVPPGHLVSFSPGGSATLRRYWQPRRRRMLRLGTEEVTERLGGLLETSLRRRRSATGPTGVLLSSGVDSKLIAAGLRKLLGASVETFTFRYSDYTGRFNEVDEARRAAEYFGTRHHEILFRPTHIADNLEWMLRSYGEPFTYGLHSCVLSDVVESGVSVLLSGAGAGYMYPTRTDFQALRYARLPFALQRLGQASTPILRRLNATTRPLWLWRVYHAAGDLADQAETIMWCARNSLPESFSGMIVPDQFRDAFYADPSWAPEARRVTDSLMEAAVKDFAGESMKDRFTLMDWHFRASEGSLHWNHWWGRAHGLSMRFPFVDDDLCDFMMQLPRNSPDKEDIRRLAARLMPRDMAYTPKISQTVPIGHWFRGVLKDFLRDQLAPARVKRSGLFDDRVVQRSVEAHIRGKNDHGWKLWAVIVVLVWQELAARQDLSAPLRTAS